MSESAPFTVNLGLRERRRLNETLWFLTLWSAMLAIAVPWYLRLLTVELGPPARLLFGFGVFVWVGFALTERLHTRRAVLATISTIHLTGVLVLGWTWQMAGGLENPTFLVLFALPVLAAGALPLRSLHYVTPLVAAAVVVFLALLDEPELRWYLVSLGLLPEGLSTVEWFRVPFSASPFPALTPAPSVSSSILLTFSLPLLAAGAAIDALSRQLTRLYQRLERSGEERERAESLTRSLIESSPEPALLLDATNLQILEANDVFCQQLFVQREALSEVSLLDLVRFTFPEIAEGVLRGERKDVQFLVYRIGEESRWVRIASHPIAYGGDQLLFTTFHDVGQQTFLDAALAASDEALLVLTVDDRIGYFNRAASELLGDLEVGQAAGDALAACATEALWWQTGPRSLIERTVVVGGRPFRCRITSVELSGSDGRLSIVRMRRGDDR
ncbi:MAG: PAS domain-containing protein [Thermoanaerobaculia bacterium]|nr:PAS domain-containing protein [Thermoanaerobaculia bacterium]